MKPALVAISLGLSALFLHPSQSLGDEFFPVASCAAPVPGAGQTCLISGFVGIPGENVSVYDGNSNWVAAGRILSVFGRQTKVLFTEGERAVRPGLATVNNSKAEGGILDWSFAFSKNDRAL